MTQMLLYKQRQDVQLQITLAIQDLQIQGAPDHLLQHKNRTVIREQSIRDVQYRKLQNHCDATQDLVTLDVRDH